MDTAFSFVAFSHEQIKATTKGAFLVAETSKFCSIAEHLLNVNQDVLADIAKSMANGETVKAANNDEELCFQVIRDLDHIGSHVHGLISSKKHMCNEIWSLIAWLRAPLWYITLSPADNRHPICLYFADNKEEFHLFPLSEDARYCLTAENPVASAHFLILWSRCL
jgi:Helitron helicase-like domain at N-terminus